MQILGFCSFLFCFIVYKIIFLVSRTKMTANVLQLGEVADLEALTFNLALNFI
jgi:hypothetical protein